MIVTVFGSNHPSKEMYNEAYRLGKKISSKGFILKNGGYNGIMEASSKGCLEKGGKVIGVCIKGHFNGSISPNKYLSKIILKKTLAERIKELLKTDVIVIFPGQIGTLEEFFIAWNNNFMRINCNLKTTPIYLVGRKNKLLLDFLDKNNFINPKRLSLLKIVDSIEDIDFLK